jgi:hypothetical protein
MRSLLLFELMGINNTTKLYLISYTNLLLHEDEQLLRDYETEPLLSRHISAPRRTLLIGARRTRKEEARQLMIVTIFLLGIT